MATQGISDVHYFNGFMADSPSLTEAPGTLIAVLKGCLIDGFGSESPQGGWEIAYEDAGAYKIVFRSTHANSYKYYLYINDSTSNYATIRGYQVMSGVDTGTSPFPASTQNSGNLYCLKRKTVGEAKWYLATDSQTIYFIADSTGDRSYTGGFMFGEFIPYLSGMTKYVGIIGSTTTTLDLALSTINVSTGGYCVKAILTDLPVSCTRLGIGTATYFGNYSGSTNGYPNPDGSVTLFPIYISETNNNTIMGILPGVYNPYHDFHLYKTYFDGIFGALNFGGRDLLLIQVSAGVMAFDITGPW